MTVQELIDQLKWVPKELRGEVEVKLPFNIEVEATPIEVELCIPARIVRLVI